MYPLALCSDDDMFGGGEGEDEKTPAVTMDMDDNREAEKKPEDDVKAKISTADAEGTTTKRAVEATRENTSAKSNGKESANSEDTKVTRAKGKRAVGGANEKEKEGEAASREAEQEEEENDEADTAGEEEEGEEAEVDEAGDDDDGEEIEVKHIVVVSRRVVMGVFLPFTSGLSFCQVSAGHGVEQIVHVQDTKLTFQAKIRTI